MPHGNSMFMKRAPGQQAAVAVERVVFGTHHRDPVVLRAFNDSFQALREISLARHLFIVRNAVGEEPLVPMLTRTTPVELPTSDTAVVDAAWGYSAMMMV